jgi:HK97 family phage portal protein
VALLDALARFFAPPVALTPDYGEPLDVAVRVVEERSAVWSDLDGSSGRGNTIAGVSVSDETAMNAPAVWACVRLISGAIAGLPLQAFREQGEERVEVPSPLWVSVPNPQNPNTTRAVFIQQAVTSMLLEGNAFLYFIPNVLRPVEVRVLDPKEVEIKVDGSTVTYDVKGADRILTPMEIVHVPYQVVPGKARGLNPIDAARQTIGLTLAAQDYGAAYFGNGMSLSIGIEYPPGIEPTTKQQEELVKQLKKKHVGSRNSHGIGALTGGAKFVDLSKTNRDSQLLELREYQVEDVGRLFGVPPHMIGSQKPGAVAYASVEQRNIDFVTHGLQPVIEKLEDGLGRHFDGRGFFKFNVAGLLRGDIKSRMEAYQVALNAKVMEIDEVRALEDMGAKGLGYLETPNNNAPDPRYEAVGALVRAGFEPAAALVAVGLPPISHLGLPPVTVQSANEPRPPQEPAA